MPCGSILATFGGEECLSVCLWSLGLAGVQKDVVRALSLVVKSKSNDGCTAVTSESIVWLGMKRRGKNAAMVRRVLVCIMQIGRPASWW